jgi:DNA (cytosine-5)-methyltransferase 1
VFVVGYLGDWRPAAEVLFERESVRGDSAPSREKRQEAARVVAPSLTASNDPSRSPQSSEVTQQVYSVLQATESVAKCLITKTRLDSETETLIPTYAIQGSMIGRSDNAGPQGDGINEEVCFTQNTTDRHAVAQPMAFTQNTRDEVRYINGDGAIAGALAAQSGMKQTNYIAQPMYMGNAEGGAKEVPFLTCHNLGGTAGISNQTPLIGQPMAFTCSEQSNSFAWEKPYAPTITAQTANDTSNIQKGVRVGMAVRRLTPVECERLQGFPDNYTNIPWRKAAESPDGPRYKALGNSMAVPVMAWIGKRIADYEQQIN